MSEIASPSDIKQDVDPPAIIARRIPKDAARPATLQATWRPINEFYTYETHGNFSKENECPKLIAWVKRCMEKESVSKVLPNPHKVYDFVGIWKKKYGVEFW
ncbi:putative glutathione S-transferase parA [Cinnamomum micranthum f. kanehirae]|uniref:Putative glutathione S-transferase parA n=1 Tax=Cinnamomum micranthum f. kanehirae TaxID=337451 RepID=A0A443Q2K8_9MAGN|nr:putative glutathione S-transferase parA [Cinnamomum micranthum f. kanehirae]